jgi:hypothetical protein
LGLGAHTGRPLNAVRAKGIGFQSLPAMTVNPMEIDSDPRYARKGKLRLACFCESVPWRIAMATQITRIEFACFFEAVRHP